LSEAQKVNFPENQILILIIWQYTKIVGLINLGAFLNHAVVLKNIQISQHFKNFL
jgi:hypothetical protein